MSRASSAFALSTGARHRRTTVPFNSLAAPVRFAASDAGAVGYRTTRTSLNALDGDPRIRARAEVIGNYSRGFDDLVEFFRQLAQDWRGWTGERVWESVEGELSIAATHHGYVELDVQLGEGPHRRWSARSTLLIEPGEQLSTGARDLADLLADRRSQ